MNEPNTSVQYMNYTECSVLLEFQLRRLSDLELGFVLNQDRPKELKAHEASVAEERESILYKVREVQDRICHLHDCVEASRNQIHAAIQMSSFLSKEKTFKAPGSICDKVSKFCFNLAAMDTLLLSTLIPLAICFIVAVISEVLAAIPAKYVAANSVWELLITGFQKFAALMFQTEASKLVPATATS